MTQKSKLSAAFYKAKIEFPERWESYEGGAVRLRRTSEKFWVLELETPAGLITKEYPVDTAAKLRDAFTEHGVSFETLGVWPREHRPGRR